MKSKIQSAVGIVTAFAIVAAVMAACTPQDIPSSAGYISKASFMDALDSYQIQGNGTMRVYRRNSDVDAYCVFDPAVKKSIMDYFANPVTGMEFKGEYRGIKSGEWVASATSVTQNVCYTETGMTLFVLTGLSGPYPNSVIVTNPGE